MFPKPFIGEGKCSEWIDHFRNVAFANTWDDEMKFLWTKVRLTGHVHTAFCRDLESWEGPQLIGANRTQIRVRGKARVTLTMAENNFSAMVIIVDALTVEAILGLEFLEKHECTCTCTYHPYVKQLLLFSHQGVTQPATASPMTLKAKVVLLEAICVPPCSEVEVMAEVAMMPNYTSGSTWMMEHESTNYP